MKEAYLMLKYKITTEMPARFKTLGYFTERDVYEILLNEVFDHVEVKIAISELVLEGILVKGYRYDCSRCRTVNVVDEKHPGASTSLHNLNTHGECDFCGEEYSSIKSPLEVVYSISSNFIDEVVYFSDEEELELERMRNENPLRRIWRWLRKFF